MHSLFFFVLGLLLVGLSYWMSMNGYPSLVVSGIAGFGGGFIGSSLFYYLLNGD